MGSTGELTTLETVKEHLRIEDSAEDGVLLGLIRAASAAIERHCGRVFSPRAVVEYHDGGGRRALVLRCVPVLSVESVHDDPTRRFEEGGKLDSSLWTVEAESGILRLYSRRFADGQNNVRVAYTAGCETVPPDVALACTQLVAAWWQRGRRRHDGVRSENAARHHVDYEAGLPDAVKALLAAHVVPSL